MEAKPEMLPEARRINCSLHNLTTRPGRIHQSPSVVAQSVLNGQKTPEAGAETVHLEVLL
jgi:hypothetical protein